MRHIGETPSGGGCGGCSPPKVVNVSSHKNGGTPLKVNQGFIHPGVPLREYLVGFSIMYQNTVHYLRKRSFAMGGKPLESIRDPYIIHLSIATCKWWWLFILVEK